MYHDTGLTGVGRRSTGKIAGSVEGTTAWRLDLGKRSSERSAPVKSPHELAVEPLEAYQLQPIRGPSQIDEAMVTPRENPCISCCSIKIQSVFRRRAIDDQSRALIVSDTAEAICPKQSSSDNDSA